MEYIWIIIGVMLGSIITNIIFYALSESGKLRIDHSNPDKDVYRIEFRDLDKLAKKKRVILKIDNNADLSQK